MFKIETREQVDVIRTHLTFAQGEQLLINDLNKARDCSTEVVVVRDILEVRFLPWTIFNEAEWPEHILRLLKSEEPAPAVDLGDELTELRKGLEELKTELGELKDAFYRQGLYTKDPITGQFQRRL